MSSLTSDIRVVHRDPNTGVLTFGLGDYTQKVSGIDRLVQIFVIALLTDAGRDVLSPNRGAGLNSIIGQFNVDPDDMTPVLDEVYVRLDKAAADVKLAQEGLLYEDPNAMLNSFKVIEAKSDEIGQVALRVRLISKAGTQADISV